MAAHNKRRRGRPDGALCITTYEKLGEYLRAFAAGHLNLVILVGERGLAKSRSVRAVLGSDYVDRSIQGADDFTRPLQTMITEWCWGEVLGDETLLPRTRSLLNIAMLSALNRKDELKLHVRGAIHNGVSVAEIRAVLLQAAVYCGVPAALDATKAAREVLKEMGAI